MMMKRKKNNCTLRDVLWRIDVSAHLWKKKKRTESLCAIISLPMVKNCVYSFVERRKRYDWRCDDLHGPIRNNTLNKMLYKIMVILTEQHRWTAPFNSCNTSCGSFCSCFAFFLHLTKSHFFCPYFIYVPYIRIIVLVLIRIY